MTTAATHAHAQPAGRLARPPARRAGARRGGRPHGARVRASNRHAKSAAAGHHGRGGRRLPGPNPRRIARVHAILAADDALPDRQHAARGDRSARKASGFVHAVKYYPAGATTNSDSGVTALDRVYPVLAAMERHGMVLSLHGEVTDPAVDMFDRERVFVDTLLTRIVRDFPGLRIVLEHITTREAAAFVRESAVARRRHDHAAASSVVAQRALRRRFPAAAFLLPADPQAGNAPAGAGRSGDFGRSALLSRHRLGAACEGHEGECVRLRRLLLGACGARVVRAKRSTMPARSTGSRVSRATSARISTACRATRITVTLVREPWTVPAEYPFGDGTLVPLRAGETLRWRLAP